MKPTSETIPPAELESMLTRLRRHYGEPVMPVSQYCQAFKTWLEVGANQWGRVLDEDKISGLMTAILKSNLLARLIYGGEKLRTQACPLHSGTWVGIGECPHGCDKTGWIPEPEDAARWAVEKAAMDARNAPLVAAHLAKLAARESDHLMAWIWFLSANFPDSESAESFAQAFDLTSIKAPSGKTVKLVVDIDNYSTGWECAVMPSVESDQPYDPGWTWLNGSGGAYDAENARDIDFVADQLRSRLRGMRGFNFAQIGWECSEWSSAEELTAELKPGGDFAERMKGTVPDLLDGLIIPRSMYEQIDQTLKFVPFGLHAYWLPASSTAEQDRFAAEALSCSPEIVTVVR